MPFGKFITCTESLHLLSFKKDNIYLSRIDITKFSFEQLPPKIHSETAWGYFGHFEPVRWRYHLLSTSLQVEWVSRGLWRLWRFPKGNNWIFYHFYETEVENIHLPTLGLLKAIPGGWVLRYCIWIVHKRDSYNTCTHRN